MKLSILIKSTSAVANRKYVVSGIAFGTNVYNYCSILCTHEQKGPDYAKYTTDDAVYNIHSSQTNTIIMQHLHNSLNCRCVTTTFGYNFVSSLGEVYKSQTIFILLLYLQCM